MEDISTLDDFDRKLILWLGDKYDKGVSDTQWDEMKRTILDGDDNQLLKAKRRLNALQFIRIYSDQSCIVKGGIVDFARRIREQMALTALPPDILESITKGARRN